MSANRRRHFFLIGVAMTSIAAACTSSDPFESGDERPLAFGTTTTSGDSTSGDTTSGDTTSGDSPDTPSEDATVDSESESTSESIGQPLLDNIGEPDPAVDLAESPTATGSDATTQIGPLTPTEPSSTIDDSTTRGGGTGGSTGGGGSIGRSSGGGSPKPTAAQPSGETDAGSDDTVGPAGCGPDQTADGASPDLTTLPCIGGLPATE